MKLPNGDQAIVDREKLTQYLLSPFHKEGRKHAALFSRLLGIDLSRADDLRNELLRAAREEEAWVGKTSPFGVKYEIRFSMTGPQGSYIILSVWMIRNGETVPRLVTAYIE